jgi:hydroxyethylthiazole kinase-like uncharacterized protein yjeF
LAVARLALASNPHADTYWIACGTGNNAGDGFAAASFLRQWGKNPVVTRLDDACVFPADAAHALKLAQKSGVRFEIDPPASFDVCIDALYGIGKHSGFNARCLCWIELMNQSGKPIVAVDVPTGLNGDTGVASITSVKASSTLSLLTLKPGLFTAQGRDACGEIWFHGLDCNHSTRPCAELNFGHPRSPRLHDTHKGKFGDVAVIGGAKGMTGAAILAAHAALHGGSGRVFLTLLKPADAQPLVRPEIMQRDISHLPYEALSVVAGCGGANSIEAHLDEILGRSKFLVLDADALNAISTSPSLQNQLSQRPEGSTVLTPHPLEAARLANTSTENIQSNRLLHAQTLADRFSCTVVLKGTGSIIAAPNKTPRINTSGNAKLAIGGSGDVLAGLIGAYLFNELNAFDASCAAVFRHGQIADEWQASKTLTPLTLSEALSPS